MLAGGQSWIVPACHPRLTTLPGVAPNRRVRREITFRGTGNFRPWLSRCTCISPHAEIGLDRNGIRHSVVNRTRRRPSRRRGNSHPSDRKKYLPWAALAALLLVLCLGWFLLPLQQWVNDLQSWLLGRGAWGVVICVVVLVVITFLPAPDWPLPIAAGYVYGVWAFPMVYLSVAFASALAFLIARHLFRDRIRAFLDRRQKYRAFDKAVAAEGWQVVVLLRLSPIVPFNLQNYALGATAIPFLQYLGATLVGIVPGIAIYVYFGIFGKALGNGPGFVDYLIFGAGVLATIALAFIVARKAKAKLKD